MTRPGILIPLKICFILSFFFLYLCDNSACADLESLRFEDRLKRAVELEHEKEWDHAAEIYLEAGDAHSSDRRLLYGLERVYRHIDDDGRYLSFLKAGFRSNPGDALLFRHYLNASVRSAGADDIAADVQLHRDNRSLNAAGYRSLYSTLLQTGFLDIAEDVLLEGEEELDAPSLFARELSDLYLRMGRYEESFARALDLLSRSPKSTSFVSRRIDALRAELSDETMMGYLRERVDEKDAPSSFLAVQARLYIHQGLLESALTTIKRLVDSDPDRAEKELINFVEACETLGAYEIEIEAYRLLSTLNVSRRTERDLEIARLLRVSGKTKEATRYYREILTADPEPAEYGAACFALGEIELYDRHNPGGAVGWFRKSIAVDAESALAADAEIAILISLMSSGELRDAEMEGEKAAALFAGGEVAGEIRFLRGTTKALLGKIDESRKLLSEVSRSSAHPRANDAIEVLVWFDRDMSPDFSITRGLVEFRLTAGIGDHERSLEVLETISVHSSNSPLAADYYYCRAIASRASGKPREAIESLITIISSFPSHRLAPVAELEMAEIFVHDLGEAERAVQHLERVLLDYGNSLVAPKARRALEELQREKRGVGSS